MKKKVVKTELNKHIKELPDVQTLLKKRRIVRISLRFFFGFVVAALIISFFVFLNSKKVQIYSIALAGNEITDSEKVVSEIQNDLSGKYLYLIPKTNIFFYPKQKILNNINKDFPRFDSVNISIINKTTLSVKVTEEKGTALWCGADSDILDYKSQCYFTDALGKIIDRAPYYSGDVYLRFFGGNISADTNPLSKTFADEKMFQGLMNFALNVRGLGFQIKALKITPTGDDFFVLDLNSTNTAFIQFRSSDDLDILFSNLQTALSKPELFDQVNLNKTNLQYFDLRFKNKVYYKFNDASTSTKEQ